MAGGSLASLPAPKITVRPMAGGSQAILPSPKITVRRNGRPRASERAQRSPTRSPGTSTPVDLGKNPPGDLMWPQPVPNFTTSTALSHDPNAANALPRLDLRCFIALADAVAPPPGDHRAAQWQTTHEHAQRSPTEIAGRPTPVDPGRNLPGDQAQPQPDARGSVIRADLGHDPNAAKALSPGSASAALISLASRSRAPEDHRAAHWQAAR